MVNKVILLGNLGQDPEIRRLENGAVVAKFSVATNEFYKDKSGERQKMTEWHEVVAWRWLAEVAEKFLKKGKQVYVEGRLTHRKWQDKDGNNRYTTEVVATNLQLLGRTEGGDSGNNFPNASDEPTPFKTSSSENSGTGNTSTPSNTTTEEVTDAAADDLPF